jgi:hypothetical protein
MRGANPPLRPLGDILRRNARLSRTLVPGKEKPMGRVFLVAGLWFLFWMSLGVLFAMAAKGWDGLSAGLMHGAWIATLTSFAWPWIMPEKVSQWMDGRG